jgi:hypothetical protein
LRELVNQLEESARPARKHGDAASGANAESGDDDEGDAEDDEDEDEDEDDEHEDEDEDDEDEDEDEDEEDDAGEVLSAPSSTRKGSSGGGKQPGNLQKSNSAHDHGSRKRFHQ